MIYKFPKRSHARVCLAAVSFCAFATGVPAFAQFFTPGNLVVSRSVYDGNPANVTVGMILPPNCATTLGACGASTGAPYDGTYPSVFNNDLYDGSFGITTPILIDEYTTDGVYVHSAKVLNNVTGGYSNIRMVTSFASKSELGLNLSGDGEFITFMGYVAPVDQLDVSNSNTPGAIDPTNPDGQTPTYRAVARMDRYGNAAINPTNSYSGNNGRAAVIGHDANGVPFYYTAGNAGNGANPQPAGVVAGAGAQAVPFLTPGFMVDPGPPAPIGSFNITQLGQKADKIGKDDNFRGLTLYNNVVYYTKGSGGNGVNTVYFIDTVGGACPSGSGLPIPGAPLPASSLAYDPATLATTGLTSNMCILAGFPTALAASKTVTPLYPFGLFFASPTVLYVSDEGDGYTNKDLLLGVHASQQATAGLQKWILNTTTNTWNMAYVMQTNLNLGYPYNVPGYPSGFNPATGLRWPPATDGLRNITGVVHSDGTATIWAISSTISGGGDLGADPNQLFVVTDSIANPTIYNCGKFKLLHTAAYGEVLRGVSFTPGTHVASFLQPGN